MNENAIVRLSFNFSLEIIEFTTQLERDKKFNMANQLFRSGTSIGANVHEAQSAESKADFRHKMKIAHKEAEESRYWLMLCKQSPTYPDTSILLQKIDEILKVLGKIILTTKIKVD